MNALKHMELTFGVAAVVICVAAALPGNIGAHARPEAVATSVPVVVIKGKRLSALEKRELSSADTAARNKGANG